MRTECKTVKDINRISYMYTDIKRKSSGFLKNILPIKLNHYFIRSAVGCTCTTEQNHKGAWSRFWSKFIVYITKKYELCIFLITLWLTRLVVHSNYINKKYPKSKFDQKCDDASLRLHRIHYLPCEVHFILKF